MKTIRLLNIRNSGDVKIIVCPVYISDKVSKDNVNKDKNLKMIINEFFVGSCNTLHKVSWKSGKYFSIILLQK